MSAPFHRKTPASRIDPLLRTRSKKNVVLFAGVGGACSGARRALGRDLDYAINHDKVAIAAHELNHPLTHHLRGDVYHYAPADIAGDDEIDFLWASPTCTYFSKAKGGPLDRRAASKVRALAWVVTRWARDVKPRVIIVENVEGFADWGPLTNEGHPNPARRGLTFRRWVKALRDEGYVVEWRELRACDYGAPTSRKRLFVIARRDGLPIVWPSPTHGRGRIPYQTAADCIDWAIPCPSIFGRKRPLAEPTLRRIARGLRKFVFEADRPYVVGDRAHTMIHRSNGERVGQAPRIYDLGEPLGTVVAGGVKHALVAAYMAKHYGGNEGPGQSLQLPLSTITCRDHHALVTASTVGEHRDEVRAFLTQYNGQSIGQPVQLPLGTITTRDRFGLVMVEGEAFEIRDIGMRMLTPRELARAQGFEDDYRLDPIVDGKRLGPTGQVRLIGNSVPPHLAHALVEANVVGKTAVAA